MPGTVRLPFGHAAPCVISRDTGTVGQDRIDVSRHAGEPQLDNCVFVRSSAGNTSVETPVRRVLRIETGCTELPSVGVEAPFDHCVGRAVSDRDIPGICPRDRYRAASARRVLELIRTELDLIGTDNTGRRVDAATGAQRAEGSPQGIRNRDAPPPCPADLFAISVVDIYVHLGVHEQTLMDVQVVRALTERKLRIPSESKRDGQRHKYSPHVASSY